VLETELFSELLFGPIVRKLKDLLAGGCGTVTQPDRRTNPENISRRTSGENQRRSRNIWDSCWRKCWEEVRLNTPSSWRDEVVSNNVMLPISSSVPSPHLTRLGGEFGLRGLVVELSYTISESMRVPLGSAIGVLKKYESCQPKSQSAIQSSPFV